MRTSAARLPSASRPRRTCISGQSNTERGLVLWGLRGTHSRYCNDQSIDPAMRLDGLGWVASDTRIATHPMSLAAWRSALRIDAGAQKNRSRRGAPRRTRYCTLQRPEIAVLRGRDAEGSLAALVRIVSNVSSCSSCEIVPAAAGAQGRALSVPTSSQPGCPRPKTSVTLNGQVIRGLKHHAESSPSPPDSPSASISIERSWA